MGYIFVLATGIASVIGTTIVLTYVSVHSLVVFAAALLGLYLLRKIFQALWREALRTASKLIAP